MIEPQADRQTPPARAPLARFVNPDGVGTNNIGISINVPRGVDRKLNEMRYESINQAYIRNSNSIKLEANILSTRNSSEHMKYIYIIL